MKGYNMAKVYNKNLVGLVLGVMHECVNTDSYILLPREKNLDFISEYSLTKQVQQSILLGLLVEDYCESEQSEKVAAGYIHVFAPEAEVTNSHGVKKTVALYIKFEIIEKESGKRVAVISFHEPEFQITCPFR